MRERRIRWLPVGILTGALLVLSSGVVATTFNVVIDSTLISGSPATLAFDFTDGGTDSGTNTVTLSALASDGTLISASPSGDVTDTSGIGVGPWIFGDSLLFSELVVDFNPMGTLLTFSFTTTDNPPIASGTPDAFALFVLDSTPAITTDDPLGTNALFLVSLGMGAEGLQVFNPILGPGESFSISVTPVQGAPEPATLALLAAGFAAMLRRRRHT